MEVDNRYAPIAITTLRVTLGVMFIAHSVYLKLLTYGLPGTAQYFESVGLPGTLAYIVFTFESVGGFMLILGVQARWVALALTPILVGASWVHLGNGWVFSNQSGGWEYPAYLTVITVCQFALGDGRYALSPSKSI